MAKTNFVQNKFVSGELSDSIKARTDLEQYYQGLQTAKNVVTSPQGGIKRRMGSEFIDVPQGDTLRLTSPTFSTNYSHQPDQQNDLERLGDNNPATELKIAGPAAQTGSDNHIYWTAYFTEAFDDTVAFIDLIGIKIVDELAPIEEHETTKLIIESSSTAGGPFGETDTNNIQQTIELPKITHFEQNIRLRVDIPVNTSGGADTFVRRYWRLRLDNESGLRSTWLEIGDVNFYKLRTNFISSAYKLHKFEVSKQDSFLLFFTPTNLRIYRVTDSSTTYLQDIDHGMLYNFPNRVASNENVLLLFNKNLPPRRLVYNYNNDGFFYYDTPTFTNIPKFDFDDRLSPERETATIKVNFPSDFHSGDRYQLEVNGVVSKEITYHGDTTDSQQTATASSMQRNLQDMPVFGSSGITVTRTAARVYRVDMAGDSANDYPEMGGFATHGSTSNITFSDYDSGQTREEPIWSATRGYPNLGVFAQGRLWIGGTKSKPQVLMASEAGNYLDFRVDVGEDSEGFLFTINGSRSSIVDVTGGRGVTVFTEGAEYSITGNTPSTLSAEQQTQHGSFSADVPTLSLDGTTLFVDRNGRSIRQFIYDYREESFRSVDMSVLSSHLIKDPVDMDAVTAVSSDDANYVFIINSDGSAVVMNTLRDQDITGFTKFDQVREPVDASDILNSNTSFAGATDKYLQVVSVNNVLHVLSETGESDGYVYKFTLSRLTLDHLLDISVKYEPSETADGDGFYHPQYLTGTKHLSGNQVVYLIAGNSIAYPRYVSEFSNVIELSPQERALDVTFEVGRNFVPTVKPMPLSQVLRNGDNIQMALKRIDRMNLRVINSAGVNIDGVAVPVREFGDASNSPLNTSLVPTTGIIEDNNGGNGFGREVVPEITVPSPTPFHLLAIDYEISS